MWSVSAGESLDGIADINSRERLDVIAAGSMTRFAGIAFEAMLIAQLSTAS